jgi:hypothetical protein
MRVTDKKKDSTKLPSKKKKESQASSCSAIPASSLPLIIIMPQN